MLGRKKNEDYYKTHLTEEEIAKLLFEQEEKNAGKKGLRQTINDTMEGSMGVVAMQVRQKYYPRWMKICGVDKEEDIDFSNPVVSTEWLLCDPVIQRELIQGRRDNVLAQMTEVQR